MIQPNKLPGITRKEEETHLSDVITIAEKNLGKAKKSVQVLTGDLKDMLEIDVSKDKETMVLWNNTQASLQDAQEELLRAQKARKKPYFGRIDFTDGKTKSKDAYYIGRVGIRDTVTDRVVIDWRAPVATVYYEESLGTCKYTVRNVGEYQIDLTRKRTYEISDDKILDFYDTEVVANDDLLTKYLAKSKKAVLGEIIATIQKEQNLIIRKSPRNNILVQGVAGSGKTTVAMHRISYILYNYENEFRPKDFYIVGSNRILLNYITSVLPDLDVYGIAQMTMEQLFVRLLYEDWDSKKYTIRSLEKGEEAACVKGSYQWFHDLEQFSAAYELGHIPHEEVRTKNTKKVLLSKEEIETYIHENPQISVQNKILLLNERIMARLENEITCRNISYTPEEKHEMKKFYRFYFGKKVWKGSIFEMYEKFLLEQQANEKYVALPGTDFDVYDLAALAYLYKRIKETDQIREASHVVIDEAQDFGMMAYASLKYCMRDCTYTIMGDVSQNIHFGYGLNDWEELKGLVLKDKFDTFGLLKKSYRNTVEISNFATNILRHGTFAIYPVEPIIRHGKDVQVKNCNGKLGLLDEAVQTIQAWQADELETIAVVCRDEAEANEVSEALKEQVRLADSNLETAEFGSGVMVLPVEYTKGLEFDAVLLYNPSNETYPADDGHVKLLYVAATRALHELAVIHDGNLTDLIAKEVPKEKIMNSLVQNAGKADKKPEQETATIKMGKIRKVRQDVDLLSGEERYTGPKRILVQGQKSQNQQEVAKTKSKIPLKYDSIKSRNVNLKATTTVYGSHQFGDVIEDSKLRPVGHGRIDTSVRFIKKNADYVELASSYGLLRIMPVEDAVIRVSFIKGHEGVFSDTSQWIHEKPTRACYQAGLLKEKPKWMCKDMKDAVGIATEKLAVKIEKKTGTVKFFTRDGKLILAEREKEPRQIESKPRNQTWVYFNWKNNEKLWARGLASAELLPMNLKGRYISYGKPKMRMPFLVSDSGYGIAVASKSNVFCSNVPMYGNYISVEDSEQIDYYFMYGGSAAASVALHKLIAKSE